MFVYIMFKNQIHLYFRNILIFTFVCEALSFFNIEELKQINYEVEILKDPISKDESTFPSVLMKSKFGQEYKCILPIVEDEEASTKESKENEKKINIKDLLKPLQSGGCLLKVVDWWTYEICLGLYIKQFHIEDGHITGQVITLGLYESDFDWTNETNQEKFKHIKQPYHSQWYVNGTKCDLTGEPRNTEIRLVCDPDEGDYVHRVDEHATCSYIITIHTPRICSHPQLKPALAKKVHTIPCHPVLSDEQYNSYMQKLKEEHILEEQKRNEWLQVQQERLELLKEENLQQMKATESNIDSEKDVNIEDEYKKNKPTPEDLIKAVEEDDEALLVQEYDKEILKLKTFLSPAKFATVRKRIQNHFDKFLKEAEEDKNPEIGGEAKIATLQKIIYTLNVLMQKLDQAEKDAEEATVELVKAKEMISKSVSKGSAKESKSDQKQPSESDHEELQVRIKKYGSNSPDGEVYEMSSFQSKQLEEVVREKLRNAGWNSDRKIEVKIISAGKLNDDEGKDLKELSEDETLQFQNMIFAMLAGQQENVKEMERQKRLEENYQQNWEKENKKDD